MKLSTILLAIVATVSANAAPDAEVANACGVSICPGAVDTRTYGKCPVDCMVSPCNIYRCGNNKRMFCGANKKSCKWL
ncbi:hypothetical protein P168DRAFT_330553 [Aspergillus campestris IBT 28561]|uniref:TIL domain-containing protein n=1 Tax=Aspergillus campestris (strain IBT 28561) TaxID=1392248 RepID=A0A2I1CRU1_ASPC2|nr:uncharacterized protein P168DRAFT_330553 [Aspergillus campestris IBT 28561]PKY00341.1 hypothetical protein P168DRAFT_330553 [Aspergillus campestris IBT 28561]